MLETITEAENSNMIVSKRKAINTLLPYAIFLEQSGQQGMMDMILHAARVSDSDHRNFGKFMWRHVVLYISRLFEKQSPTSLNRVITLMSPFVDWEGVLNNPIAVTRWAAAASVIPYTEEVGHNVVDALLQISSIDLLRPHIPIDMWGWIKKQLTLPRMYHGLQMSGHTKTVAYVRRLGDVDLLKSYFLLIWADQITVDPFHIHEMERSIREVFGGVGMEHHRKDLIERLDHILGRLDRRTSETPFVRNAKTQYTKLKGIMLEVDGR